MRGWVVLPLMMLSASVWGQDLIIEAWPGGKNSAKYKEISGKWVDSRIPPPFAKSTAPGLTPPGVAGGRKCLFSGPNVVTTGPAVARFLPQFPSPGRYFVYATWPRGANAMPVYYDVQHASGISTIAVAQNGWGAPPLPCNAGTWVPLGEYDFLPGENQHVTVRIGYDVQHLEPRWYGQVYCDAVCFSRERLADVGTPMPPEAPPAWPGTEPPIAIKAQTLDWLDDLNAGWDLARKQNKRLMLYCCTDAGQGKTHFEQRLFQHAQINAALSAKFVPVRLSIEKNGDFLRKLGIYRGNMVVFYDISGKAIGQITNFPDEQEFLTLLASF